MASRNIGQDEDVQEDYKSLLRKSDSEDEDPEDEFLEFEFAYEEPECFDIEPALEYVESPPTRLRLYTQEGEGVSLGLPQNPPMGRSSPAVISPRTSPSPSFAGPMVVHTSGPRAMQPLSPPRAPVSRTLAEDAEDISQLVEVCAIVEEEDCISLDDGDFHLADEHHTFQPVVGRPSTPTTSGRPQLGARGDRPRAGKDERCVLVYLNERCVRVYLDDDDVPEDVREAVLKVIRTRASENEEAHASF